MDGQVITFTAIIFVCYNFHSPQLRIDLAKESFLIQPRYSPRSLSNKAYMGLGADTASVCRGDGKKKKKTLYENNSQKTLRPERHITFSW